MTSTSVSNLAQHPGRAIFISKTGKLWAVIIGLLMIGFHWHFVRYTFRLGLQDADWSHVLIIPREHIATINDITDDQQALVGSLYTAARDIAKQEGLAEDGYRVVMNCGEKAGQSVFHIHLHLLGGRALTWPPG